VCRRISAGVACAAVDVLLAWGLGLGGRRGGVEVEGRDFVEGILGDSWVFFNIFLMIGRLSTAVVLYIQERGIFGLA